jgi:putative DNA primase/helicase
MSYDPIYEADPELREEAKRERETFDDAAEIKRLAKLRRTRPLTYARERKAAADKLGCTVSFLDKLVDRENADYDGGRGGQGRPLELVDAEPWHSKVDGASFLGDLAQTCRQYVVMPESASHAVALWIAHTYCFSVKTITPRLIIKSAQKRSGKTTLLMIIGAIAARALSTASITAAAVYRTVEMCQPTLLIDEADTFLTPDEELVGVLNNGYIRGGQVIRTVGDNHDPRVFSCWCPVALALIRRLKDTLEDRSVAIKLKRRLRDEPVTRLRVERLCDLAPFASKGRRWTIDNLARIDEADPSMPRELNDREADCWRILMSIADVAGGSWPELARKAATTLSAANNDTQTNAERLLIDLRDLFNAEPSGALFSEDLANVLGVMEHRPWPEWGKQHKPITKVQIARLLDNFGINPKTVRLGTRVAKGYEREQFNDAFERYA